MVNNAFFKLSGDQTQCSKHKIFTRNLGFGFIIIIDLKTFDIQMNTESHVIKQLLPLLPERKSINVRQHMFLY